MAVVPLREGLFHIPESTEDEPYLIGTKCRVCGYTCFPKKEVCVRCRTKGTVEDVQLGRQGTLETFAVMQVGPPDFPPPYVVGYVRTQEGPVVFSLIAGCELQDDVLEIGQEMELVIDKIRGDAQGNDVIGWKFKPVRGKTL